MTEIRKAAVFGAGVMGAAIAGHIANAGIPVILFDIAARDGGERNGTARRAIDRLLKTDPEPLMHPRNAALLTPAAIEDDMGLLSDCDWIIEAIVEKVDAKRALYERIEGSRKPGSIVSSNTSTISLAQLIEGAPPSLAGDFLITHFFNPPRYQRLLEIVTGPATRPEAVTAVENFADHRLGKTPVRSHDTPGFIANRIGIYWLQRAVLGAIEHGLTVEEADAAMGAPLGIPKTGVFGLLDMVGLDIIPHVLASMGTSLKPADPFHAVARQPDLVRGMIAEGYTGRKGKGGFYRLKPGASGKTKESIDLKDGSYRDSRKAHLKSLDAAGRNSPRALLEHPDKGGRYAFEVMAHALSYAIEVAPEVADDIASVDDAMRLGYGWKYGPFELVDRLGPSWFTAKLAAAGLPVPRLLAQVGEGTFYRVEDGQLEQVSFEGGYRAVQRREGLLLLSDIKRRSKPIARNRSASLWDIGDGVACLEFHSKMNSINPLTLSMVRKATAIVGRQYRALVIHNEGSNFSIGANIFLLLMAMKVRAWFLVPMLLRQGQSTFGALKHAQFPVVGAPSGMALGGGCEVLLHCDAVQAHAESYIGLVEAGVGIVPGWGGCKELVMRRQASGEAPFGPMPPVTKSFETIAMATVARSAEQAKGLMFLRRGDGITMNRDRLLADAKAKALKLAENYSPPERARIALPGRTAQAALKLAIDGFRRLGKATPHDVTVGGALASVLSGGDTDVTKTLSEDDMLALERRAFLSLARTPQTVARVAHMLKTGKPLRN